MIQWTPKVDANGEAIETLLFRNQFYIQDEQGNYIKQERYISDADLNQEGDLKIFTPQPNSFKVEWVYLNLLDTPNPAINFKIKMVSLPEINAINNF